MTIDQRRRDSPGVNSCPDQLVVKHLTNHSPGVKLSSGHGQVSAASLGVKLSPGHSQVFAALLLVTRDHLGP